MSQGQLPADPVDYRHRAAGGHLLDRFARFMRYLEKEGHLNRPLEFLPDDEVILERMKQGIGLTRPEIAVLLSYSKIVLYDDILASRLPDDPFFEEDLRNYFPTPLRKKYAADIARHRLRREIITTVITNELVNRVGINFIYEVQEKTGLAPDEITRAYLIAVEIFGIPGLWREIEALDNKVPALLQSKMLVECGRLIERETVWFLREAQHPLSIESLVADYGPGVSALMAGIYDLLSETDRVLIDQRAGEFTGQGAPAALARRIAGLGFLVPSLDIVRISRESGLPVEQIARLYFAVGERFGFDWLRRAAAQLSTDTAWDKLAVTAIVDDFFGHQSDLTTRIIDSKGRKEAGETDGLIEGWASSRRPLVARSEQLIVERSGRGRGRHRKL